ncbi:MAG TPA: hypothetical protein DCE44_14950 [Verrucomicrobiales bacterium]|nr:hypothetical protein [Verrucomicrobiales bacterium]
MGVAKARGKPRDQPHHSAVAASRTKMETRLDAKEMHRMIPIWTGWLGRGKNHSEKGLPGSRPNRGHGLGVPGVAPLAKGWADSAP